MFYLEFFLKSLYGNTLFFSCITEDVKALFGVKLIDIINEGDLCLTSVRLKVIALLILLLGFSEKEFLFEAIPLVESPVKLLFNIWSLVFTALQKNLKRMSKK